VAQLFPTEPDDQVGLDTPAAQSGYASFVIGNEGEVNKMIAKKETGKYGKGCSSPPSVGTLSIAQTTQAWQGTIPVWQLHQEKLAPFPEDCP
jgi:hypothetical protein